MCSIMRSYSSIYAIDDSSRKFALGGENFSLYLTALLRWSSSMINDYQTYKLALQGFSGKKNGTQSVHFFMNTWILDLCSSLMSTIECMKA